MVISSFGANDTTSLTDNYCLRLANAESVMQLNSVVFACQENEINGEQAIAEGQGAQFATVASGTVKDPTAAADTDLQLLEGTQPIGSLMWNVSMIDGAAPLASTAPTSGVATDILGALSLSDDWTAGWTYGIHPDNRGQALWFE
jgi:hypothetical protein